uniref:Uncharacterized protein n=1 Tax=Ralstonia solanacearum TaxID=305 RepID=A0A0S4UEX9_RALSL|nr:protein of unknown function [Ralstonia solanacearum]
MVTRGRAWFLRSTQVRLRYARFAEIGFSRQTALRREASQVRQITLSAASPMRAIAYPQALQGT